MKYVILGQLAGIGGWQLYIDARASYLTEREYEVCLISISKESEIKLPTLLNSNHLCIPEVHLPPASYSKKQQDIILNKIYSFLGTNNEEMTIESTDMNLSMWGEIIAEHYNARNFSYLLHSHFPPQNQYVKDFFLFKYRREELAGMSEYTLPELFYDYPLADSIESRNLPAAPKDPITDENTLIGTTSKIRDYKCEKEAFVIGYFGNLDKPHFTQIISFIDEYARTNSNQEFVFVTVGSSGDGKAEKKQKKIETNTTNCKTINIPAIYPVPKEVFQIMDICLASWGSAENSARAGALTIRLLDDVTITPQGIVGITVSDYRSPRCKESLEELIDKVRKGEYRAHNAVMDTAPYDYIKAHKQIDQAVFNATCPNEYYDISKIKVVSRRSIIEKILNTVFGIETTKKIRALLKKILAKPYAKLQRKETYAK